MKDTFFDRLLAELAKDQPAVRRGGEPVVDIRGALRHLTALYERLRSFVDYQEERFIRRLAIRRILFRQLIIEGNTTSVGERLLRELIRAAYLENNRYPARLAGEIDDVLTPYRAALPILETRYAPPELLRMQRRLLGLAAAAIEDRLHPAAVDRLLAGRLAEEIAGYLDRPADEEIHIIALRALWKADAELVAAELLHTSQHELARQFAAQPTRAVGDLLRLVVKADFLVRDRTTEAAVRRFARLVPPYLILADLAMREASPFRELTRDPDRLGRVLESLVHERLEATDAKLHRSIIRTTIYIFATKIVIGVAAEIPYDLAAQGKIEFVPLTINLLIPPLLMFAAGLGIRTPGQANTELIIDRARRILASDELPPLETVEAPENRRPVIASLLFFIFYLATYVTSFGGLVWLLTLLNFNVASILVFLFFLSVVGFFAFRIRTSARELAMVRERESFVFLIFDFFALPFLRVGRFLSVTIRQMNIFLFLLDFLIEAPVKIILVALEDWFAFLREKREELS